MSLGTEVLTHSGFELTIDIGVFLLLLVGRDSPAQTGVLVPVTVWCGRSFIRQEDRKNIAITRLPTLSVQGFVTTAGLQLGTGFPGGHGLKIAGHYRRPFLQAGLATADKHLGFARIWARAGPAPTIKMAYIYWW